MWRERQRERASEWRGNRGYDEVLHITTLKTRGYFALCLFQFTSDFVSRAISHKRRSSVVATSNDDYCYA